MSNASSTADLGQLVRDGVTRTLGAVGLAGIALIHLLDAPNTFSSTPYIGWMYVGAIVSSLILAGALIHRGDSWSWGAAAALAVSIMLGYTLSRTTGLPGSTDDIGNWGQSLGIASLFIEGSLLAVSSGVLWSRRAQMRALRAQRSESRLQAVGA